jgi:hypothetical protein
VNTIINFRVPWEVGDSLTSWATISLSRRTLLHEVKSVAVGGYRVPDKQIFHVVKESE